MKNQQSQQQAAPGQATLQPAPVPTQAPAQIAPQVASKAGANVFEEASIERQSKASEYADKILNGCSEGNTAKVLQALQLLKPIGVDGISDPLIILQKLLNAICTPYAAWQDYLIRTEIAKVAYRFLHMVFYKNHTLGTTVPKEMVDELVGKLKKLKRDVGYQEKKTVGANGLYYELDALQAGIAVLFDKSISRERLERGLDVTKFVLNIVVIAGGETGFVFTGGLTSSVQDTIADATGIGDAGEVTKDIMRFAVWVQEKYRGRWYTRGVEFFKLSQEALKDSDKLLELERVVKSFESADWQTLYAGIEGLYQVINEGNGPEVQRQALWGARLTDESGVVEDLPGLLDFLRFDKFKIHNNWRIREKALECCIKLLDHPLEEIRGAILEALVDVDLKEKDKRIRLLLNNKKYIADFEAALKKTWERKKDRVEKLLKAQMKEVQKTRDDLQEAVGESQKELKEKLGKQSSKLSSLLKSVDKIQKDTNVYSKLGDLGAMSKELEELSTMLKTMSKEQCEMLGKIDKKLDEALGDLSTPIIKILKEKSTQYLNQPHMQEVMQGYVGLKGKNSISDPDDKSFELSHKVTEFISGSEKVMLLVGDPGTGKTTFCEMLEKEKWEEWNKTGDRIPIVIPLGSLKKASNNAVAEALEDMGIAGDRIYELKKKKALFIFDGYDELPETDRQNLFETNRLSTWNDVKAIITCREQYVTEASRKLFIPIGGERALMEIHLAGFTDDQIRDYLDKFLKSEHGKELKIDWDVAKYMEYINKTSDLRDIASTPIILKMIAEELPKIAKTSEAGTLHVTNTELYKSFMDSWFKKEEDKLVREGRFEVGIIGKFWEYSKKLAKQMYTDNILEFASPLEQKSDCYWSTKVFKNQTDYPLTEQGKCFHALPLKNLRNGNCGFWHIMLRDFFALGTMDPQVNTRKGPKSPLLKKLNLDTATATGRIREEGTVKEEENILAKGDKPKESATTPETKPVMQLPIGQQPGALLP